METMTLTLSAPLRDGFKNAKDKLQAYYDDYHEVMSSTGSEYSETDVFNDITRCWNKQTIDVSENKEIFEELCIEFISAKLLIRLYDGKPRLSTDELTSTLEYLIRKFKEIFNED